MRRPLGSGKGTFPAWRDQVVKQQEALDIRNKTHAEVDGVRALMEKTVNDCNFQSCEAINCTGRTACY